MSSRMLSGGRVLVVDDEPDLAALLSGALSEVGYDVSVAGSIGEARRLLQAREFDVALLDMHLPDGTGADLLREIVEGGLGAECIMLTGDRDVSHAVQAMKLGATDYLTKPTPLAEVEKVVAQARDRRRLKAENAALRLRLERHEAPRSIVTEDPVFLGVIAQLPSLADSDLPVLIHGEPGTGKALLARALHDAGRRRLEPFVEVACTGVAEADFDLELYGRERDARSSAEKRQGLIELADRGTLFIDEIADLAASAQHKLLRTIESGEYSRLGSERVLKAAARFVAATARDLTRLSAEGHFRKDLQYLISGVTLRIPPLRERKGDILPLALHFLRAHGVRKGLSPQALDALKGYSWPGNARELQMVVRRAAVLARGERIEARDLTVA